MTNETTRPGASTQQIEAAAIRFAARVSGHPKGWTALNNGDRESVRNVISECAVDLVPPGSLILGSDEVAALRRVLDDWDAIEGVLSQVHGPRPAGEDGALADVSLLRAALESADDRS